MIVPIDAVLRREVEVYSLRFTCESCAHLDDGGEAPGRCSLGFPNAPHLAQSFEGSEAGFLFCKAFELS